MRPWDEQLPQRDPASPTLTADGVTSAAAAYSATSRDMTSSARRLRNSSVRRARPASVPPQRNSPSIRTGVRGEVGSQAIRTSLPSSGMNDPGSKGSPGSDRASCVSIQSRWSSAQAKAARRLVRHGQVSLSLPLASSNRRRRRRAVFRGRISMGTGSAASRAASERPVDHMIFQLPGVILADGPAAGRLTRFVHGLAAPGDQIVPVRQGLASGPQAIGTGRRQPVEPA